MCRFNQGSVIPSNLRLDGPEKVRRPRPAWIGHPSNLLTSSNLPARAHMSGGAGARTHTRTRVQLCTFRLDKVRRLDRARQDKASGRLTSRPTFPEVGR